MVCLSFQPWLTAADLDQLLPRLAMADPDRSAVRQPFVDPTFKLLPDRQAFLPGSSNHPVPRLISVGTPLMVHGPMASTGTSSMSSPPVRLSLKPRLTVGRPAVVASSRFGLPKFQTQADPKNPGCC